MNWQHSQSCLVMPGRGGSRECHWPRGAGLAGPGPCAVAGVFGCVGRGPGCSGWAESGRWRGRRNREGEFATDPWAPSLWLAERLPSFCLPELRGRMDRHRPRLHHPAQSSSAGAPCSSSALPRSSRESKMPRRKGPQHPPPPGGLEEPGEKRPKFVSSAWSWGGELPPCLRLRLSPGILNFSKLTDLADSRGWVHKGLGGSILF